MKEILLKISEEVLNGWKQELYLKHICGNFDPTALADAVPALIIKAIEEDRSEVEIIKRKKGK